MLEISKRLTIEKFLHDDYVFKQDEEGDKFYIILSGTILGMSESSKYYPQGGGVITNDKEVCKLTEGQSFGELALISGASRSLSMKSYNNSTLVCLHKTDFLKCFGVSFCSFRIK